MRAATIRKLLSPYRLCHVDVTTDYGQKVAKAFKAKEFPHVAIIDKTGSVVIFRKTGQIKQDEWKKILTENKSGERSNPVSHVTLKPTGESSGGSYCPSCQNHQFYPWEAAVAAADCKLECCDRDERPAFGRMQYWWMEPWFFG